MQHSKYVCQAEIEGFKAVHGILTKSFLTIFSCYSLEEQNLTNEATVDFSGNITCELGLRTGQPALDQRR